jgi:hypothetical protein
LGNSRCHCRLLVPKCKAAQITSGLTPDEAERFIASRVAEETLSSAWEDER